MTQEQTQAKRKKRAAGDEGAAYTKGIADAAAARRDELEWSAERLAAEMAAVGVPWTRDVVVNLENGRRKTIAVHEAVALAYVLELESPLNLLVPGRQHETLPVTPTTLLDSGAIRAWLAGKTGPLRQIIEGNSPEQIQLRDQIRDAFSKNGLLDNLDNADLAVEEMAKLMRSQWLAGGAKALEEWASDDEGGDDGGL